MDTVPPLFAKQDIVELGSKAYGGFIRPELVLGFHKTVIGCKKGVLLHEIKKFFSISISFIVESKIYCIGAKLGI